MEEQQTLNTNEEGASGGAQTCPISQQTVGEEIANAITHGIGLALSLAGFAGLMVIAYWNFSPLTLSGLIVYGLTLILLYAMSTGYHLTRNTRIKRIMRILDHSSIYLLIAGTYTPFTFGALRGWVGWTLFTVIWALAITGIIFKSLRMKKKSWLSTLFYLLMGWLVVVAIRPLFMGLSGPQFSLLMAGGAFYTLGTFFFAMNRIPYNHSIWHLFVLGGSICHYASIVCSVIYPVG